MDDSKKVHYNMDTPYEGFGFVSLRGFMNRGEGGYQRRVVLSRVF